MSKIVVHFHRETRDAKTLADLRAEQGEDRARIREAVQALNAKIEAYNARTKRRIEQATDLGSNADSGSYIYGSRIKVSEVI